MRSGTMCGAFHPTHATGAVLWANLHLLFWLSLFPFATAWMGQNHFSVLAYVAGIAASFSARWLAQVIYAAVALAWLIPDRRIEAAVDLPRPHDG